MSNFTANILNLKESAFNRVLFGRKEILILVFANIAYVLFCSAPKSETKSEKWFLNGFALFSSRFY